MNPAQLLSHFDRISDAPDAIPRLRQFILDLAVRGKLVEQDPKDEPASELLKRIRSLNKAGSGRQLNRSNCLKQVDERGWPFPLPDNWAWIELGAIAEKLTDGSHNPPVDAGSGFPMLSSQNVLEGTLRFDNPTRYLSRADFEMEDSRTRVASRDVLLTIVGSIGRSAVVPDNAPKFALQRSVAVIRTQLLPEFLSLQFRSPMVQIYFNEHGKGTAQKGIYLGKLAWCPIAVPPLAEQHRIVAKVDELMAFCDRLEAAQGERESRRDRLVTSSLNRLNNGVDPDAFRDHARFYFNHLPRLTTRTEHIQQLRQTILNLAVRGKLVTQDPNDEPASELLKRVQAERTQLIESGNITKNEKLHIKAKPIPPDYCPPGWSWVRLRDVIWCYRGHNPPKSDFVTSARPGYVRFIQITDFKTDSMAVYVPITRHLKMVYRGEIIMAAYRHVGKVSRHVEGAFNVALCKVNEIGPMNRDFTELLIGTDLVRGELLRASERGHIPSMHSDHLLSLWVPIPPQLEQKRILEKYAELIALCDKLDAQLTTTYTDSRRLLEALLDHAVNSSVA